MSLSKKINSRQNGILTYGFTPPKENNTQEKIKEIAQKHIDRLNELVSEIDAVVLYDIQDEKDRITDERTFPFLPTIDPEYFGNTYLNSIDKPKIIYRCVGKYSREQFIHCIRQNQDDEVEKFSVFVGASSDKPNDQLKLVDAYDLFNEHQENTMLGGVLIPERHVLLHDEHLRVTGKSKSGCSFFISQAVYDLEASKNFLSDYYYYCLENEIELNVILFTLSPCGSEKTMNFMKWLGISIPKWMENDLLHSQTILDDSVKICLDIFDGLSGFAMEKNIPVGFNIESVSIRKTEIEASIFLTKEISRRLKQKKVPAL
ncbi:MAG: 5,10-methylenetetrahydrofolate reductase [Bacteroidota bacterium]|nr:5,10-methylenetetrahydrofolate reductase [Bacteroidota bacterium]